MLEEIQFDYKVTKININKNEQFKPEFKKKPFVKIPVTLITLIIKQSSSPEQF